MGASLHLTEINWTEGLREKDGWTLAINYYCFCTGEMAKEKYKPASEIQAALRPTRGFGFAARGYVRETLYFSQWEGGGGRRETGQQMK